MAVGGSERSVIVELDGLQHVELFAGGGGLAVGAHSAGIRDTLFAESDVHACATLSANARSGPGQTTSGRVVEGDVRLLTWPETDAPIQTLSAGAPCQPFSVAGTSGGYTDTRNGLPEIVRAMKSMRPRAVLVENVPRLASAKWEAYFNYFVLQLQYPSLCREQQEKWQAHAKRLARAQALGAKAEYVVTQRVLNSADYGVPQVRRRLFIVALSSEYSTFTFPAPTHSWPALANALSNGAYWERHGIRKPKWATALYPGADIGESTPWITVRDALAGLPKPARSAQACANSHWAIPGARSYKGHSGSVLDMPAKTVKAGVHGVPGGENSVVAGNGKLRYFTMRELARIQTFPDNHSFDGARIHLTRLIGNAVPCKLATVVYAAILRHLALATSPEHKAVKR